MHKKVGRPKKLESERIKYQHVAIYLDDYLDFKKKLEQNEGDEAKIAEVLGRLMRAYEPDFDDEKQLYHKESDIGRITLKRGDQVTIELELPS